jgi:hypothetical protein
LVIAAVYPIACEAFELICDSLSHGNNAPFATDRQRFPFWKLLLATTIGRWLSVRGGFKARHDDQVWGRQPTDHQVTFAGGADLPVYLRVTQADGHQAWTSPVCLIE